MAKHSAEDYADSENVALGVQALADVLAMGQSTEIRGKKTTRAKVSDIIEGIEYSESRESRTSTLPRHTYVQRGRA